MTIKTLWTNTEIIITNINQITKATLGLNTDIDHNTHQTLQPIIDHHPTMAGHRNNKVTIEVTLTEITIGKIVGIDRAKLLQDQITDIMIGVGIRIVIGHLLDKAMLIIQEIAVMGEALESTLPAKLPEAIKMRNTTTTSI